MLIKCSGIVTPHFVNNRSLISYNNVEVPSSVHYSPSEGSVLLISLENLAFVKINVGLFGYLKKKKNLKSKRSLFILQL